VSSLVEQVTHVLFTDGDCWHVISDDMFVTRLSTSNDTVVAFVAAAAAAAGAGDLKFWTSQLGIVKDLEVQFNAWASGVAAAWSTAADAPTSRANRRAISSSASQTGGNPVTTSRKSSQQQ